MIDGMTIKIKDVKSIVNNALKGIRIKEGNKYYKKSKKFRKKNGFYYEEVWNLDNSIAAFILPRLIHFRDNHSGIPNSYCKFAEDGYTVINLKEAEENWKTDIAIMIEAFYYCLIDDFDIENKHKELIDEGLKIFSKNFSNLWD